MKDSEIFLAIRKHNQLSQKKLAQRLEVTVDTVRGIEQERWCASSAIMKRLSVEFSEAEFRFCGVDTTISRRMREVSKNAIECYKSKDYENAYRFTDEYTVMFNSEYIGENERDKGVTATRTNIAWAACVGRMLEMTRAVKKDVVSSEQVKMCIEGIRIGGYKNFSPYDEIPVHLTDPVKQLLNLWGLMYMRLENYDNASRLFRSLFLCLESDLVGYGAREDIYSQMAAVEYNLACSEYMAGRPDIAIDILDRALIYASDGAPAKRIGEILKCRMAMTESNRIDTFCIDNTVSLEKYYCMFALSLLPENKNEEKRVFEGILML